MSLFFTETMSGWSQPLMGGPVMHQQMQEQSAFSQHQAMERDDTGIVAPSNTFHQPLPTNFMDFPNVCTVQWLFKIVQDQLLYIYFIICLIVLVILLVEFVDLLTNVWFYGLCRGCQCQCTVARWSLLTRRWRRVLEALYTMVFTLLTLPGIPS